MTSTLYVSMNALHVLKLFFLLLLFSSLFGVGGVGVIDVFVDLTLKINLNSTVFLSSNVSAPTLHYSF